MTPTLEQAIKLVEGLNIVWQCPRCGSRHFGSTFGGNPLDVVSRICHDEYARGCNWSGPPPEVEPRDAILAAMEQAKAKIDAFDMFIEAIASAIATTTTIKPLP